MITDWSCSGALSVIILRVTIEVYSIIYKAAIEFRDYMRAGATDKDLQAKFREHFGRRAKNGFEAEQNKEQSASFESMATIGG